MIFWCIYIRLNIEIHLVIHILIPPAPTSTKRNHPACAATPVAMAEVGETKMLIPTDFMTMDMRPSSYVVPELTGRFDKKRAVQIHDFLLYWHWFAALVFSGASVISLALVTFTDVFQNLDAKYVDPVVVLVGGQYLTKEKVLLDSNMAILSSFSTVAMAALHIYIVIIGNNWTVKTTVSYIRYEYDSWIHARWNPARNIAQGWVYGFLIVALAQIVYFQDVRMLISLAGMAFFSQIFILVAGFFSVQESSRSIKQLFILMNAFTMLAFAVFPILYALVKLAWFGDDILDDYPKDWTTALVLGLPGFMLLQSLNELVAVAYPQYIYWIHELFHILLLDFMTLGAAGWFLLGTIGSEIPVKTYI
jgi:hypothetical protein